MSQTSEQEMGTLPKLIQMGLVGAAGNAVTQHLASPFLDGAVPAGEGVEITDTPKLEGADLHTGPNEGGAMLDRPVAGFLADQSAENSLGIEYSPDSVSQIAAGIDQAGTLTVNGETIKVLDYAPGGDFIQAAGGTELDAADGLGMMGHAAMASRNFGVMSEGSSQQSENIFGHDRNANAYNPFTTPHRSLELFAADSDKSTDEDDEKAVEKTDSPLRQQLEADHRLALQAALQTSDEAQVETSVKAGNKTLKIKTEFEARHSDQEVEQKKGEDHLQETMHRPSNDVQSIHDHMRMRSQIEAYDIGMGLTL